MKYDIDQAFSRENLLLRGTDRQEPTKRPALTHRIRLGKVSRPLALRAAVFIAGMFFWGCQFDSAGLTTAPSTQCPGEIWQYAQSTAAPTFNVTKAGTYPSRWSWKYFAYNEPYSKSIWRIPLTLYVGTSPTAWDKIPDRLKGNRLLQLDRRDRSETQSNNFLQLAIKGSDVDRVWIAFDNRATALPNWLLSEFKPAVPPMHVKSTAKYVNQDSSKEEPVTYVVYEPIDLKQTLARDLSPGGNNAPGVKWKWGQVGEQYLVLVRTKPTPDTSILLHKLDTTVVEVYNGHTTSITEQLLRDGARESMKSWLDDPKNSKYKNAYDGGWVGIDVNTADCDRVCETISGQTICKKVVRLTSGTGIINAWVRQCDAEVDVTLSSATVDIPRKGSSNTPLSGSIEFLINRQSNVEIGALNLFAQDVVLPDKTRITNITIGQAATIIARCDDALPPGPFRLCGTYIIPSTPKAGFKASAVMKVDGDELAMNLENNQPVRLDIDFSTMSFHMWGGPLTGTFRVNGKTLTVNLSVQIVGNFTSLAPVASVAETKRNWECGDGGVAEVLLSASASLDELYPGSIVSYRWVEDAGQIPETQLGTGVNSSNIMAFGTHDVTLFVTDIDGVTNSETFQVNVQDSQIDTMVLPNDVSVMQQYPTGATVTIGNAFADDYCLGGAVEITNDAPISGFFPLGLSVVHWRLDDLRGNVELRDQKVFVAKSTYFPPPMSTVLIAQPQLLTGQVQEIVHETSSQGLAVEVDEYIVLHTPDGGVASFDEANQIVQGALVAHARNATFGENNTVDVIYSGVFSEHFPTEGLYVLETILVEPGGSPDVPRDIIAYDSITFFLQPATPPRG